MTEASPSSPVPVRADRIRVGFGWAPIPREPVTAGRIMRAIGELWRAGDLPSSAEFRTVAVLSDRHGAVVSTVHRDALYGADGAVAHEGDRVADRRSPCTGSIFIDLRRVPAEVERISLAVSSLTGFGLSVLDGLHCRLVDDRDSTEIARYDSSYRGPHNTEVLACLTRGGPTGWAADGVGRLGSCSSTAKVARFAAQAGS